ncbi:DNA polymerase III subunit chi [Profundibacter amoris]|uniref:DNA polymerase III subunit chi n=1 Tax=Profundibacter amoris TaxID=2171755 RepID=A0A347UGZ1_9RHOB|nr:DNA polymerase III subunit chi [Profundibacter amoris]AXX98119.1 DNA polymerase III subunit chi [Profundibacter amoris]
MGAVYFYHLTRQPLEMVLPMLLEKSMAAGWRCAVRGVDVKRLEWLDEKLWLGREDGFLPHGLAGGDHDAMQPVLLTVDPVAANNPTAILAIDGAEVSPEEVAPLERVSILFDGNDDTALTRARSQWKALTDAGCSAQYWSQESGQWEKKAER